MAKTLCLQHIPVSLSALLQSNFISVSIKSDCSPPVLLLSSSPPLLLSSSPSIVTVRLSLAAAARGGHVARLSRTRAELLADRLLAVCPSCYRTGSLCRGTRCVPGSAPRPRTPPRWGSEVRRTASCVSPKKPRPLPRSHPPPAAGRRAK